jgi:hypothetical protein
MDSYLTEEALWASGLASRLKLLQANFADDAPAARQTYITEEIERALKNVVPARRKLYLEALAEQFPAWQSEQTVPIAPTPLGAAPESPSELLARFLQVAGTLSPDARAEFVAKLSEAGLAPKHSGPAAVELTAEQCKSLGLPAGAALNVERAIKLLAAQSPVMLALDQLVWTIWKQLAPRSVYRREADTAKLVTQYLSGDQEVATQQLTQALERMRRLVAGFVGAVRPASTAFAKTHVRRFSPEEIKGLGEMEKTLMISLEVASWRVFARLANEHLNEPAIQNALEECTVKVIEDLVRGAR